MNILVTGGAGFIGTNLIRHLLTATEHRVLNLDKLTYAANPHSLDTLAAHPRYQFAQADIADAAALRVHLETFQPEWVIHLAAETHVDRSIDGPSAFIQSNINGTFALLEAARAHFGKLSGSARLAFRLLHVSTDEVYGSLPLAAPAVNEAQAYAPRSPYAASKAASDHLARAWAHTYALPLIVSTCSNNYGPYQFPEKLIPLALLKALHGAPIPIYGTGENRRDWLHVTDHIEALLAILQRGKIGETYHIGSGTELRNIDLARQLCAILDELRPRSDGTPYAEQIRFVADRPGHDIRYALDTSKIRREIGWSPSSPFAEGLRQTIRWYLANPTWWQPILNRSDALQRLGQPLSPALLNR